VDRVLRAGRDQHHRSGADVLLLAVDDHQPAAGDNHVHLLAVWVGVQRLLAAWGSLDPGDR
jgi:hypothetical protein